MWSCAEHRRSPADAPDIFRTITIGTIQDVFPMEASAPASYGIARPSCRVPALRSLVEMELGLE